MKHAWNTFKERQNITAYSGHFGSTNSSRPDRVRLSYGNEHSIVTSILNRIAIDVAAIQIKHVKTDENGAYLETIKSSLNNALTIDANIDQTGRVLIHDAVLSMCDEGCIAIVPVDTDISPDITEGYMIKTLRVGRITEWQPRSIRAEVYNDQTGNKEQIPLPKSYTAIVENPLYAVMNEPNSVLRRLVAKLNLLDAIDNASGSGKLDLLIQLPYVIKTEARRIQAEQRIKSIEDQLKGSKYGIAYTDGTEKVTQLNRPVENNLMAQITYLTSMLFSQLGLTQSVFDGTADEATMLNYYSRTIEPMISAITTECNRKFLTKTARTQHQTIMFFKSPFKLIPVSELANIADKFTRNEILSSNEVRAIIGYKPSKDPKADELRNKNIPEAKNEPSNDTKEISNPKEDEVNVKKEI